MGIDRLRRRMQHRVAGRTRAFVLLGADAHHAARRWSRASFVAPGPIPLGGPVCDVRVGGGTAAAALQLGRWTLGGDAIADSWRRVDGGEFAERVAVTAYVPEARSSLIGSVGFDDGDYAGLDLTAECLVWRWRAITSGLDLRPRVWAWARVRHRDGNGRNVLTPAAALSLQHFALVGSQLDLALSAESELADECAPLSRALAQVGFGSIPRPLWSRGDPDSPDAVSSTIQWSWFATLAYAVPLDSRARAGLVVQGGARFLRPFGR